MSSQREKHLRHILAIVMRITDKYSVSSCISDELMLFIECYRVLDCVHVGRDQKIFDLDLLVRLHYYCCLILF
jgi:hypothetical protein